MQGQCKSQKRNKIFSDHYGKAANLSPKETCFFLHTFTANRDSQLTSLLASTLRLATTADQSALTANLSGGIHVDPEVMSVCFKPVSVWSI